MMTACRYGCAIIVFLFASLTPTSCSDVSEPAVAADKPPSTVVSETVRTYDDLNVSDSDEAAGVDAKEIGS